MVCVVGIPDPINIDLPAAVIIRSGEQITADKVYRFVEGIWFHIIFDFRIKYNLKFVNIENAADFKRLRGGIYFVDKFPLSPNGKVLRKKVQEIAVQEFLKVNKNVDLSI